MIGAINALCQQTTTTLNGPCPEHKAIARKDLERICSELCIPNDFDIAQISWRPVLRPFLLSRAFAPRSTDLSLSGHTTYVFAKPRRMEGGGVLYIKISREHIRRNRDNVGERLDSWVVSSTAQTQSMAQGDATTLWGKWSTSVPRVESYARSLAVRQIAIGGCY